MAILAVLGVHGFANTNVIKAEKPSRSHNNKRKHKPYKNIKSRLSNIAPSNDNRPTNWLDQAKYHATETRSKAVGDGIFSHFSNFDKCRPEAAGDVISGMAVE